MAQTDFTPDQALTAFKHKNFQPLYFIYGEEPFLANALQQSLIENGLAEHERDFNFDLIYGAESSGVKTLSYCQAYPMMAERRIVIIRDFEKLSQNAVLSEYAKKPNPQSIVMLICGNKPNLATNPYKALKQLATVIEVKALKENQLGGWIQEQIAPLRKKIRPEAVQMLISLNGNHLQVLHAEIEKLVSYIGKRDEITREDVLDVGGHAREFNVFELQKKVGEADFLSANYIMEQMLQQKTNTASEALMIVVMLTRFFNVLWKLVGCQHLNLNDKAKAERVGISPYFIKEYILSLRYYPYLRVQQAFSALLAADYELKGGSTRDPALILNLMLRKMMR